MANPLSRPLFLASSNGFVLQFWRMQVQLHAYHADGRGFESRRFRTMKP